MHKIAGQVGNGSDPCDLIIEIIHVFLSVLWIWIRSNFGMLDPDPGGQKGPTIKRKVKKFYVLNVLRLDASSVASTSFMEA
jgi:hypothetical protein